MKHKMLKWAQAAAIRCAVTLVIVVCSVGHAVTAPAVIDARTSWLWFQSQTPSRHLLLFPDGTIVAETWNNVTFPLLDPRSGTSSLFPGQFQNGSIGVAPNPIVWPDPAGANLVGAWGSLIVYQENGSFVWRWDNVFGCCNNLGLPYIAVDVSGRRVLASLGYGLYTLPIGGPPPISSTGGQASGLVSATSSVAYVAGTTQYVSKWDITGTQPVLEWSQQLSSAFSTWNFSEGAIAADGTFVVTRSGNHASPYWSGSDIWRAGELYAISPNGQSTWTASALATTPPVIGRGGLIYVGGLPSPGAPQSQLDGAGVVRAYDRTGVQVWSTPTTGLPQDLFVGDDGKVYVLAGGTTEGRILALDQASGAVALDIEHIPAPWEMILKDGIVYATGDAGIAAIPLPAGFAWNYDAHSPWPVRQHDNQRTSQQLTNDDDSEFAQLGANTFTSDQTVIGKVTAAAFVGDGSQLSNVTAVYATNAGTANFATTAGTANFATTAGTANVANSASVAANASALGGALPATAAMAGTIAARDGNGDLFANVFRGSGAALVNIPATALPNSLVYNNQANSFSGTQTIKGQLQLPAIAQTAGTPSVSQTLNLQGWDGANPTIFQWSVSGTGKLDLQTATGGNATADSGLTIAPNGTITFAAGQTFPGAQTALTAGAGIGINGTTITNAGVLSVAPGNNGIRIGGTIGSPTISNTGVLSFNGRTGSTSPAANDYSFGMIAGTVTPNQVSAGTYAININGNATTATNAVTANSATAAGTANTAGNAGALGGVPAGNYARLDVGNSFTGNQTVSGNLAASGSLATAGSVTIGGGTAITRHLSQPFAQSFTNVKLVAGNCMAPLSLPIAAADGDTVVVTLWSALLANYEIVYSAWASAGAVSVRICNPTGATFFITSTGSIHVDVWKH